MVDTPEASPGFCPKCGSDQIFHAADDNAEWKCGRCQAWFAEPVKSRGTPSDPSNKG